MEFFRFVCCQRAECVSVPAQRRFFDPGLMIAHSISPRRKLPWRALAQLPLVAY
jgi:hypothetical protein